MRNLDAIAQGDMTIRVKLRKKDHLHEIAEGINQVVANWHETQNEIDGQIQALKGQVGQLDESALLDKLSSLQDTLAGRNQTDS